MMQIFSTSIWPADIHIKVEDLQTSKSEILKFRHSRHSFRRASQRGISKGKISTVLEYGTEIYKQGLTFFILGAKDIPDTLSRERNKLLNTVVVVAGDSNEVITCYRARHPYRQIRMKSKRLSKCR